MGEVYRARDTKLHRDVAIKILPEVFALDPERLALKKIPLDAEADVHFATWSADGDILLASLGIRSELWRFERASQ